MQLLPRAARALAATAGAGLAAAASLAAVAFAQAPELNLDYEAFTLDNGLQVIVHEDRKAPVVAVSVWYNVGSRDEPAGKTGFAHLFEHLMFNGSEHYDGEWFEPLEEIGATDLNGTTWLDRTNYFQTVPTPALDRILWMESDRMGHLLGAITQDKLDVQRGVVQNEKRQGDNQPYGRINYNLYEGLFPKGHPYHHSTIGSMEDLEAASLDDVKQWFTDYYGPNNAILVLAGDIDAATARPLVETYFGDIAAGPEVDRINALVPVRSADTHEMMFDEVPAVLANRAWAVPGRNTREAALLTVAASVLGDGKNSRFYKDLIYDKQAATSVDIGVTKFVLSSVFDLSVTLKPDVDASVASEAMDRLIAEFIASGPTAQELERAKAKINASTVRGLEKVGGFGGKAVTLAEGALYAGDPRFIDTWLGWINEATSEEVRAAAQTWLSRGSHQVDVVPTPERSNSEPTIDRTAGLPAVSDTPELVFPDLEQAELRNGMRVVLARRDAVPVVNMAIQFDAGYAADATGRLGAASFTMAMLDEGAGGKSALEIAAEAERLGAQLSTSSTLDTSAVTLSALTANLQPSIDLMASVVRDPAFDDAEIERLRARWIAQIAQEKANPVQLALRLLPPAIYGGDHAYGVPFTGSGTEGSISALTRDDLTGFHATWIRPDNATVVVVGDTDMATIKPMLERAFRNWRAPQAPLPEKNVAEVELPEAARVIIVDKPGSPQSMILAGSLAPPTGVDNNIAIEAMNDILGGQFTARVNMNLREEKSWAYGAYTFMQGARGQRPWLVYAPVQTDKTADSMAELVREFEDYLGDRPATAEELAKVVANSTKALPGQFETGAAVLGSLRSNLRYGRPLDYASSLPGRYGALDLEDIGEAAAQVVNPDSLIWIVVGDRAEIEGAVRALDLGPVAIWTDDGDPAG